MGIVCARDTRNGLPLVYHLSTFTAKLCPILWREFAHIEYRRERRFRVVSNWQGIIDRRFYRRKYDAARTLAAFSAAGRQEVDIQQLHKQVQWCRRPCSQSMSHYGCSRTN